MTPATTREPRPPVAGVGITPAVEPDSGREEGRAVLSIPLRSASGRGRAQGPWYESTWDLRPFGGHAIGVLRLCRRVPERTTMGACVELWTDEDLSHANGLS